MHSSRRRVDPRHRDAASRRALGDRVRRRPGFHRRRRARRSRGRASTSTEYATSCRMFRSRGSARSAGFRRSRARSATLVVRGTIFAPYGRDADVSGAVYALSIENRGAGRGHDRRHARGHARAPAAARADAARRSRTRIACRVGASGAVLLEGSSLPGLAAARDRRRRRRGDVGRRPDASRSRDRCSVAPGGREQVAFYLAVGPERDGAEATAQRPAASRMARAARRRRATRCRASSRAPGNEAIDRLINRNLLFAYFYAVGRALDDAQYYLVRTRAPWNGHGVTVRDWEALMWTIPAVQLADPPLARELLLRMCELHGYAPGRGVHYLDGTLFEPGFALEGVGELSDRDGSLHSRHGRRSRRRRAGARRHAVSRRRGSRRAARQAHSAVLDGSESVGRAGRVSVHAARATPWPRRRSTSCVARSTRRRRAGSQDPDAVRAAINRHFVVEASGQVDVRVGDRSRRRDVDGRRSRRRRRSGCRSTRR